MTYDELVDEWTEARISIGDVMEYSAHKDAQKARLLEGLRDKDCEDIRKLDVIREVGALRKTHSATTVRCSMKRGKSMFKWGRMMGMTDNDPFDGVPMPKPETPDRKSLQPEDARRLREELDGDTSEIALMATVALMTGMRYGEVLALRGCDVEGCTISVNQSVKCDLTIGEPKTKTSRRSIAVPRWLADRLKERGDGRLFSMSYNQGQHAWAEWREAHGFPGLKFHELRHTHATLLIANGVDVKTVQHRLGHSSATITLDVYAHAVPSLDSDAAARIERIVG